ncbi:DeoR/GlpR family DNA-binding transcription regulator [Naasia lichenicola]|uniref:DeoR/GlpR transcriptional regulator n=1 Tax=Naasia lichenicola TaxID=2565933 RepID=A0A4S4FJC3_9MICO|nr:DeoR/GlpR family DNA-binding transcription regulator [Naasia lichenicola]THG29325.1 DeoR/GlpR transcriptional regulator [Naasia lichenicola]
MSDRRQVPERLDGIREEVILHELRATGKVSVRDLAERLNVSEVTIRKDLDALEERSLLRRVRGGAVPSARGEEGAFADRMLMDAAAKRAIAREVAKNVQDGDSIAIDSSTTSYYLAQELVDRDDLIVVTFGLRTAVLLLEQSNATVVMPGGVVRRASGGMVGSFGNTLAGRGRLGAGFFGTATLSIEHGMLELSSEEAATKRALVAVCDEVHVSLASSKIGRFGINSFASASEVTRIYTDELADDAFLHEWEKVGTPVVRVAGTRSALEARALSLAGAEREAEAV